MKKLLILLCIVLPVLAKSQAHLGATMKEIKDFYPNNIFTSDVTVSGNRYITTEMDRGSFTYYFDSTGLSYLCTLIPKDLFKLNEQVQEFNHEYVITSDTTWKAYLDGGSIMYIKLSYSPQYKLSSFIYSSN